MNGISAQDRANQPPPHLAGYNERLSTVRVLRVLVACEFSGIVRDAFLEKGHDAWSCDLLPAEHNRDRHIQCDVRDILNDGWNFLIVAHPPCTRLWFGAPLADTPTCIKYAEFLASQAPAIAARQGSPLEFNLGETKWTEIDITLGDELFVVLGDAKIALERVRIGGQMAYSERSVPPIFKALVIHNNQEPFVGCAISEVSGGNLMGISLDPNRKVQLLNIPIADRLLKKIYRLRLGSTASAESYRPA
jgi:hypothetical protein